MRTSTLCLLLCLVLALAPDEAQAQKNKAKTIKTLLRTGNKLFASGDYPAAYEAFKKGYELRQSPVFLRSMAYSLLKMYQHGEARKLMKEYQRKYPGARDRARMAEIATGLDVVIQTKISVSSTPPGADIYIDAEAAGRVGKTPYRGTIHPGKHTLILKKDGYYTTVKEFSISPKQDLPMKLALKVPLKINSTPPGATILLGGASGKSLGTTPFSGGVEPGKITVTLKLDNYRTHRQQLKVVGGRPAELTAEMFLGLKVGSSPPGAQVTMDGKPLPGKTPMEISVQPGQRKLVVKLNGFDPVTRSVTVTAGQKPEGLQVKLKGGLLTMRTNVEGAKLTVGGIQLGKTPVTSATVPLGKHQVKLTHAGRREWARALDFSSRDQLLVDVKMGHSMAPFWISAGVSAVGLLVGSITGIMAIRKVNEANDQGRCAADGTKLNDQNGGCGFGLQHASTTGFVTGGVAAGVALVYYLLWARDSAVVSRKPL